MDFSISVILKTSFDSNVMVTNDLIKCICLTFHVLLWPTLISGQEILHPYMSPKSDSNEVKEKTFALKFAPSSMQHVQYCGRNMSFFLMMLYVQRTNH